MELVNCLTRCEIANCDDHYFEGDQVSLTPRLTKSNLPGLLGPSRMNPSQNRHTLSNETINGSLDQSYESLRNPLQVDKIHDIVARGPLICARQIPIYRRTYQRRALLIVIGCRSSSKVVPEDNTSGR